VLKPVKQYDQFEHTKCWKVSQNSFWNH